MVAHIVVAVALGILGVVHCGQPEVPCPAPVSPQHGKVFLYQEGRVLKYVCEPGYALKGKEIVRCIEGKWEEPDPACLEIGTNEIGEAETSAASETLPPIPAARPLFSWGSEDSELDENNQEVNDTAEEIPLSDEARVRLLMYPRRRVVTSVKTARLLRAGELEEEEKKRSQEEKTDSTTIHLESPPSVVYVKRTVIPGKSEAAQRALENQYKAASLHMTVENGNDVQFISLPRAAVSSDDKGYQSEQTLRQLYWYAHHYPTHASIVQYHNGQPVVMSLTESQLAWINSLHPELRDQYLKDLYLMRADETVEGQRAQAFLQRYENAYNYLYHAPYLRRPVSLVMEDPITAYDYTCHESGYPFIKGPKLRNMHVQRYDRRQNPNNPYNHYLAAVYRCNPGYRMLDTRYTELYCSKKDWIGVRPVCVRRS